MAESAVFLDRDGTINKDVPYCRRPEDFHLFPGTARAIRLLNEHGYKVIVITNQSGVGRGYFTEEAIAEIHEKMKRELAKEGAYLDDIYYCPHHPDDNCDCRKPKPKLALQAANDYHIDLKRSFVVGNLKIDIMLGKELGCRTILVGDPPNMDAERANPDARASDLLEVAQIILRWEG